MMKDEGQRSIETINNPNIVGNSNINNARAQTSQSVIGNSGFSKRKRVVINMTRTNWNT